MPAREKKNVLTCKQEFGKNAMELSATDFKNAPYIKLHSLTPQIRVKSFHHCKKWQSLHSEIRYGVS